MVATSGQNRPRKGSSPTVICGATSRCSPGNVRALTTCYDQPAHHAQKALAAAAVELMERHKSRCSDGERAS